MLRRIPTRVRPAVQLFCIPHAGNGPSAFRGWGQALLPEIETIIVELPGRESRFHEPPYRHFEPLIADLSRAVIDAMDHDLPFAFFGNSMGGIIAFETIHQIRRLTGRDAMHLFVSAVSAPQCQREIPDIGLLDDEALVRAVGQRYGAIPAAVLADKEFLASVLPTLRADIQLLEAYRYKAGNCESLACPITAFGGKFDRTVPSEKLEAWKAHTSEVFRCYSLEEGHLFLESARKFLIEHLRTALSTTASAVGERQ